MPGVQVSVMAANPNEPKSVSMILKQRQQSRSSAVAPKPGSKGPPGPGGATINESLNPVLPPLYPSAPKSIQLNPQVFSTVKIYNKLSQYFRSNFSVPQESKGGVEGFYVDRYTDQYKSPLALKPHLLQKLPDSKYPEELTKKAVVIKKPIFSRRKRRRLEDIFDEDADSRDTSPRKSQDNVEDDEDEEKEENVVDDNEDLEDEMDEEMDVGTDYALSYFDNGEADDDDRDEDDGPTY